jgi:hypothetical protein
LNLLAFKLIILLYVFFPSAYFTNRYDEIVDSIKKALLTAVDYWNRSQYSIKGIQIAFFYFNYKKNQKTKKPKNQKTKKPKNQKTKKPKNQKTKKPKNQKIL